MLQNKPAKGLGLTIDNKLNFDSNIRNIYRHFQMMIKNYT